MDTMTIATYDIAVTIARTGVNIVVYGSSRMNKPIESSRLKTQVNRLDDLPEGDRARRAFFPLHSGETQRTETLDNENDTENARCAHRVSEETGDVEISRRRVRSHEMKKLGVLGRVSLCCRVSIVKVSFETQIAEPESFFFAFVIQPRVRYRTEPIWEHVELYLFVLCSCSFLFEIAAYSSRNEHRAQQKSSRKHTTRKSNTQQTCPSARLLTRKHRKFE